MSMTACDPQFSTLNTLKPAFECLAVIDIRERLHLKFERTTSREVGTSFVDPQRTSPIEGVLYKEGCGGCEPTRIRAVLQDNRRTSVRD
jgi:hypothetical protein